jgi:hypothetical protein
MLFVFPFIRANSQARSWASKNANAYMEALRNKNYTEAAIYISRVVLADATEVTSWVAKMEASMEKKAIHSYQLGRPEFGSLTGNFSGEARLVAHVVANEGGKEHAEQYTIRLMEDERHDPSTIRVFDAPEVAEELDERVVVHPLLLKPVRKDPESPLDSLKTSENRTEVRAESVHGELIRAAEELAATHVEIERRAVERVEANPMPLDARAQAALIGVPRDLTSGLIEWVSEVPRVVTPTDLASHLDVAQLGYPEFSKIIPPGSLDSLPLRPEIYRSVEELRKLATAVWIELLADRQAPKTIVDEWKTRASRFLYLQAAHICMNE